MAARAWRAKGGPALRGHRRALQDNRAHYSARCCAGLQRYLNRLAGTHNVARINSRRSRSRRRSNGLAAVLPLYWSENGLEKEKTCWNAVMEFSGAAQNMIAVDPRLERLRRDHHRGIWSKSDLNRPSKNTAAQTARFFRTRDACGNQGWRAVVAVDSASRRSR